MAKFTRADAASFPRRTVTVAIDYVPGPEDSFPEIHAVATLREFSGADRATLAASVVVEGPDGKRKIDELEAQAGLVARCWIDPDTGLRQYADDEVKMLANDLPASILGKLSAAAQKLNGIGVEATEETEKN